MTLVNSPININGNTQLANQSSSGDGSSGNPYIIENYIISNCPSNTNGVYIQNTNKYFILNNITVFHCYYGFHFTNITFGRIINSFSISNTYMGFMLDSYSLNSLSNNTLSNNIATGNYWNFYIASSNNMVVNNVASNGIGFDLLGSKNTFINNVATNNTKGLDL